jgi:hypothetical protein
MRELVLKSLKEIDGMTVEQLNALENEFREHDEKKIEVSRFIAIIQDIRQMFNNRFAGQMIGKFKREAITYLERNIDEKQIAKCYMIVESTKPSRFAAGFEVVNYDGEVIAFGSVWLKLSTARKGAIYQIIRDVIDTVPDGIKKIQFISSMKEFHRYGQQIADFIYHTHSKDRRGVKLEIVAVEQIEDDRINTLRMLRDDAKARQSTIIERMDES